MIFPEVQIEVRIVVFSLIISFSSSSAMFLTMSHSFSMKLSAICAILLLSSAIPPIIWYLRDRNVFNLEITKNSISTIARRVPDFFNGPSAVSKSALQLDTLWRLQGLFDDFEDFKNPPFYFLPLNIYRR